MTPIEQARLVYATEFCPRTFEQDLQTHLNVGYVISTPEVFLMGRPVQKDADYREIVNPSVRFYNPDCWLVYLAAGDLSAFFQHEPYALPWFGWERSNKLRFYPRHRVAKVLGYNTPGSGTVSFRCPSRLRPTEQGRLNAGPAASPEAASPDYRSREFAEAQSTGQHVSEARVCFYDSNGRSWHTPVCAVAS